MNLGLNPTYGLRPEWMPPAMAGGIVAPPSPASTPSTGNVDFGALLQGTLRETAAVEQNAQTLIGQSLAGEDVSQVEVLTAVKKADLSLRMMLQIRNTLLEAYNEIKGMQF